MNHNSNSTLISTSTPHQLSSQDSQFPPSGEYVLCKNKNTCVDAKKTNTNVVRYANDSRGSSFSNNAYVRPGSDVLRAGSRGIPANREVF